MRKYVLLLFFCWNVCNVNAQNCESQRYQFQIFSDVDVAYDVIYSNADPYDILNQDNPQDYGLDIYQPVGDPLQKRPVVFMFYGGSFINGDKSDADIVAWCDSLARYGYVAVAVNYRLGFNYVDSGSPIRAVYRAMQDLNAAVRFMLEFQEDYRIDPDHIYLGGKSAGGILVLHSTFMGEETDRPEETYGTLLEGSDLGCISCSGNNYQHDFEIKGVIGLWGAIEDLNNITSDETIPTLMVHGDDDSVVPYDEGYPYTGQIQLIFPYVYGSQSIHEHMNNLGLYNEFYSYDYGDHDVYGSSDFPNENWLEIFERGHSFYYKTLQFQSPEPMGETQIDIGTSHVYNVVGNPNSEFCWEVAGGTITNDQGTEIEVQWNATSGMVSVTEKNELDVVGEVSTLNIGSTTHINNPKKLKGIKIHPTLLSENDALHIILDESLQQINLSASIFDAQGRRIKDVNFRNNYSFFIEGWAKGIYFLRITDGVSVSEQKIIIK